MAHEGIEWCTDAGGDATKWSQLTVRSSPVVSDPRELNTILVCSLRDLWGELEPHSSQISVQKKMKTKTKGDKDGDDNDDDDPLLVVTCPKESTQAVQAALTLVTPPSYLEETIYRFDVVEIKES